MKHLKKFENFELNRLEEENEQDLSAPKMAKEEEKEFEVIYDEEGSKENFYGEEAELDEDGEECEKCEGDEEVKDWNDAQTLERVKSFGSFVNEEKKFSAKQLAAQKKFKERLKGKKSDDKEDDKEEARPDFLDLDKDGDKKEPMKKAAKDAKETGKKDTPIKKVPLKERILKSQTKK